MVSLVKLPNGQIVNPAYVTAIEYVHGRYTLVWVVKNSGYGTASYEFAGDQRETLAAMLGRVVTNHLEGGK